jgi:hypothetical protein
MRKKGERGVCLSSCLSLGAKHRPMANCLTTTVTSGLQHLHKIYTNGKVAIEDLNLVSIPSNLFLNPSLTVLYWGETNPSNICIFPTDIRFLPPHATTLKALIRMLLWMFADAR